MSQSPITKNDDYTKSWHKKYGAGTQNDHFKTLQDIQSPMSIKTATKGSLRLPSLRNSEGVELEPVPFRFTSKNTTERIDDAVLKNSNIDTQPVDVDKKAFDLRLRQPEKELAHSKFRLKNFSTIDRLNSLYENDNKILDVETLGVNAGTFNHGLDEKGKTFMTKRRLTMP